MRCGPPLEALEVLDDDEDESSLLSLPPPLLLPVKARRRRLGVGSLFPTFGRGCLPLDTMAGVLVPTPGPDTLGPGVGEGVEVLGGEGVDNLGEGATVPTPTGDAVTKSAKVPVAPPTPTPALNVVRKSSTSKSEYVGGEAIFVSVGVHLRVGQ